MFRLDAERLVNVLHESGIKLCVGVPDSTLGPLLRRLSTDTRFAHVGATNEGEAIGIATGHFLSSASPALVYMQNSGFGNAINPLSSLASRSVAGIPMVLVIGWRAAPGHPDEPQHGDMGRALPELLIALGIEFDLLENGTLDSETILRRACERSLERRAPYALLVKPDHWQHEEKQQPDAPTHVLTLDEVLRFFVSSLPPQALVVATTGTISRALFALRQERGDKDGNDFYMVGSMGYASAIGLGMALSPPHRPVVVLDGDGACLMHLGNLATIGAKKPANLFHIVIDNEVHGSTGGQATVSPFVDLSAVARACGYKVAANVQNQSDLAREWESVRAHAGPCMLRVKTAYETKMPARPSRLPRQITDAWLSRLGTES